MFYFHDRMNHDQLYLSSKTEAYKTHKLNLIILYFDTTENKIKVGHSKVKRDVTKWQVLLNLEEIDYFWN